MFVRQIVEELAGQRKNIQTQEADLKEAAEWYSANQREIARVSAALVKIEVINAVVCNHCIDLSITGDKHVLKAIFGAFRKLGYEPNTRPGNKNEPTFSCYWEHPELATKFWLYFTSSKCTRVKVGTETKEIDIYETRCE